jgi:hypothetical protein
MTGVRKPDLIDYWTRFARLRGVRRAWWLQPLGWTLIGAALATWAADGHLKSFQVGGVLLLGGLCVFCDRQINKELTENVENICNDFGRFLARWSEGPDHDMSNEYVSFLESIKPESTQRNKRKFHFR